MVHEIFHLLEQQLAGECCAPGDQVPLQGPYWMFEGIPEYVGFRAASANGLITMADARADWISRTKQSTTALSSMGSWNGFFADP